MASRPRIVFWGTPDFAVPSLEACLTVGEVVGVVTQPDKPKGRGRELTSPPVKVVAQTRGLFVLQPSKLKSPPFAPTLAALAPDVCVVTAYGKILPREVLEVPPLGCVNVHASLLPRFRGAAPIQWAIAAGDTQTGVCLMKMDEGMDTGPLLACEKTPILPSDTAESLHDRLATLGYGLIVRELPRYFRGELSPTPQPSQGVVMAPMLEKEDGRLDFSRPAVELERRLRAFAPWPGTFTTYEGELLKVKAAQVGKASGAPGTVLSAGAFGIEVACGQGSLLLTQLQPEGKRAMSAAEFLAGRTLHPGDRPFDTLAEPNTQG
ncbi:MAG: methionyl-tRNA formyltransferase [Myxococcota bacterium]